MSRMLFAVTLVIFSVLAITSGASLSEEDEELLTGLEDQMENSEETMMYAASDDADNNEAEMAKRGGKARYRRW
ncbi:hypothetical protein ACHWQZ_G018269 [Mnemiopsis leidyi]